MSVAAPILTLAYDDSRLLLPLIAVGGLVVMDGLKFPIWWHYREMRFGTQRTLMVADAAGAVIFAIPLLAIGWDYWALIAGAAIASACTIVFAWAISPHPRAKRPTRETINRYASFGGPVLAFALVAVVCGHLGYLAVRHSDGLEALGWLGVAGFPYLVSERLANVLNQSVYPALVRRGEASRERAVELMQRMIWALLAPALLVLAATAPWLLPAAIGDDYETAGWLMSVVAVASIMHQFGFPFAIVVMSTGSTRAIGRFSVIYLVAAFVVVLPATLAFGVVGWAATLPVVELMFGVERWRIMRDHLPGANLFRDAGVDLVFAALPALGALAGLLADRRRAVGLAPDVCRRCWHSRACSR